jgi:hypothetical protein
MRPSWPPSGRNATYPAVQISRASSHVDVAIRAIADVRVAARNQNLSAWIEHLLVDLCKTRQVRISKMLHIKELGLGIDDVEPDSDPIAEVRQKELEAAKSKLQAPSSFPASLWHSLGMAGVLPDHLRPGKYFR